MESKELCNDCAIHYYDQMSQRHYCSASKRVIDSALLGDKDIPVPKWCPRKKDDK